VTQTTPLSGMICCRQAGWDLLPLTYRPNLTFLITPITKIWKALQNVEIEVAWRVRSSRSSSTHRTFYSTNRNCASILYHFRDITSYLSKVADLIQPHQHLAPPPVEFRGDLWHQKTTLPGLLCGTVNVILRLAVLVELWLVTDRQT